MFIFTYLLVATAVAIADDEIANQVSRSVVRIKTASDDCYSGVIISEDGYVVWPGASNRQLEVSAVFPSGESASATNLGWSTEWQVGLLKLKGDRKWPHVPCGSNTTAKAGDACFEVGFHRNEGKIPQSPVTQRGKLTFNSPGSWFTTDLKPSNAEFGSPSFAEDGKVLGIAVAGVSQDNHLCVTIDPVVKNLQVLKEGKNLDWIRFPPSQASPLRKLAAALERDMIPRSDTVWKDAAPAKLDDTKFTKAREVAKTVVVRLITAAQTEPRKAKKPGTWSGVLISPDGYISTCAHCEQLPGEKIRVILPDNREVAAVAVGTNWVTDVALVKIIDQGPWPFAELGDSSNFGPGDALLAAGFPAPHKNPLPSVSTAIRTVQLTPYIAWSSIQMLNRGLSPGGGASGGGVFDSEGKLVAIYNGEGIERIEVLRAQMDDLKRSD